MEKLIEKYQKRVQEFDKQINDLTEEIRKIRRGELSIYNDAEEAANERKMIDGKRQLLFQVTKDLEDFI
jgi:prefoldin subunit 5